MGSDLQKRIIIFLAVLAVAVAFLLPTILREKFTIQWVSKPISLGLDLSGGVHILYEVQAREAVVGRLQSTANSIRADLRNEKIAVTKSRISEKNQLELTLLGEGLVDKAKKKIEENKDLTFIEKKTDNERPVLVYGINDQRIIRIEDEAVNQAVETLRNRVDQFGVSEPLIQRVGEKRILLQMPGVSDIEQVKSMVGKVAKLEFRLVPRGEGGESSIALKNREGNPVRVEDQVLMTGDAVDDARAETLNGQIEVLLSLTTDGGRAFSRLTTENVSRNLAIVLDGVVYSSPEIREPITGGSASISGGFTYEEASLLAKILRAGALPASLKILEERTVGPTLGKESIQKGILAITVGFASIIVFMLYYYRKAGMVAVGNLLLNLIYLMALLSAFGATLTLPGLAGLALTIGMAVDSNVIIFERIRDELRLGATRDAAVVAGFDKALSAIIDSNVTTLLAGLLLYYFGTGPIRGFAVTLCIGIATTIYCATVVSRLAFDYFSLRSKEGLSI